MSTTLNQPSYTRPPHHGLNALTALSSLFALLEQGGMTTPQIVLLQSIGLPTKVLLLGEWWVRKSFLDGGLGQAAGQSACNT